MKTHPMQQIDDARFVQNDIVRFLLDQGPFDLSELANMNFDQSDWEQFAQLIGYSLTGFGELSYVRDETYEVAVKMATGWTTDG